MKRVLSAGLSFLCVCALTAQAAVPFEMLFRVRKPTGTCTVQPAGAADFIPAIEDRTYVFGTSVRTAPAQGRKDPGASCVIELSSGNFIIVFPGTVLTMTQAPDNEAAVVLKLAAGKVEVDLDSGFREVNTFGVETPLAMVEALACRYTVEVRGDGDSTATLVQGMDGTVRVRGTDFELPEIGKDDWVSLSGAPDRSFIRIKNEKGDFNAQYRDAENNPRVQGMQVGSTVKVFRRISDTGNLWVVTLLLAGPDGALVESVTYTVPARAETGSLTGGVPAEALAAEAGAQGAAAPGVSADGTPLTDEERRIVGEIPPPPGWRQGTAVIRGNLLDFDAGSLMFKARPGREAGLHAWVVLTGLLIPSAWAGVSAGVTVILDGPVTRQAVTDEDGNFVFTDLPPGNYTVSFQFNGQTVTYRGESGQQPEIIVGADQLVELIDIRVVGGKVNIGNIRIFSIVTRTSETGEWELPPPADTTTTTTTTTTIPSVTPVGLL